MNISVSNRVIKIARAFALHGILPTSQICDLAFSNLKICQRWLRKKCRQGYLSYFPLHQIGQSGRSERIYYLNPKKASNIRALLHLAQDYPLTTRPPGNPVKIDHHLKISRFIIALTGGLGQKYSLNCIPEYGRGNYKILKPKEKYISDCVILPVSPFKEVTFIPDAVLFIKSGASGQKALFFLEIDNGSESVKLLKEKLLAYTAYASSRRFQRYSKEFDYPFKGFRTLIVTSGDARLNHLSLLCQESGPKGLFWLTTFDRITPLTVLTPIWTVAGTEGYSTIVKIDEKEE